jgi:hypothetical protein
MNLPIIASYHVDKQHHLAPPHPPDSFTVSTQVVVAAFLPGKQPPVQYTVPPHDPNPAAVVVADLR